MEQSALLVRKEDIEKYVEGLLVVETEVIADLERILPYTKNEAIRKSLETRLRKGKECLRALQEGFVPLDSGYFTRVDIKDRWGKNAVKAVLDSMPPEVKEVWEKVKEKGIFKSFAVTTAGGDPILAGRAGGKNFFIAGWLNFSKGISLGIRIKI